MIQQPRADMHRQATVLDRFLKRLNQFRFFIKLVSVPFHSGISNKEATRSISVHVSAAITGQKMKFSIKDFFSK